MSAIDAYLADLDAALTAGSLRRRRRILAEAEDHLRCAAEAGDERAAIAAFGPPELVARRFAEELAHAGAARATWAALAVVALFGALVAAGSPGDAIPWFAAQIAVHVCRAQRRARLASPPDTRVPAGKLRFVNRGVGVALGAVLVAAASDLATGNQVAGAGLVGIAAVAAALVLAGARLRLRGLAAAADEPAADDAFDDVLALAGPVLARVPARGVAERLAGAARARPWLFCLLVAGMAGGALAVSHGVGEPPDRLASGIAAGAALFVIEGGAVVICFALLGRFLGIRGAGRQASAAGCG